MHRIAIVCNDAGGAEQISHWVSENFIRYEFLYCLGGPAKDIFKRNLNVIQTHNLEYLTHACDTLICGSSWSANLERKALKDFKAVGKYTICFLDHWVNYRSRFYYEDRYQFPDEFWVTDAAACENLLAEIQAPNVKVLKNFYLEAAKRQFSKIKVDRTLLNSTNILYLTEPIKDHVLSDKTASVSKNYDEFEAFNYFCKKIGSITSKDIKIFLKTHPAEDLNKYNEIITSFDLSINVIENINLLEAISKAKIVVGCETMAMMVADAVGKTVLCSIPPGGNESSLPLKNMKYLRDI